MDKLKENIWKNVIEQVNTIVESNPGDFRLNPSAEEEFNKQFDYYYDFIKNKVMVDDIQNLDRHKLAAVIICAISKAGVMQPTSICKYDQEQYIFDGNEKIAINVGLNYMKSSLKALLCKRPIESEKFTDFILPQASMCDTNYISILCRNMYYAQRYYSLNPIDLANTLFLLEYVTLVQIGVDPKVMKELCDEVAGEKKLVQRTEI